MADETPVLQPLIGENYAIGWDDRIEHIRDGDRLKVIAIRFRGRVYTVPFPISAMKHLTLGSNVILEVPPPVVKEAVRIPCVVWAYETKRNDAGGRFIEAKLEQEEAIKFPASASILTDPIPMPTAIDGTPNTRRKAKPKLTDIERRLADLERAADFERNYQMEQNERR